MIFYAIEKGWGTIDKRKEPYTFNKKVNAILKEAISVNRGFRNGESGSLYTGKQLIYIIVKLEGLLDFFCKINTEGIFLYKGRFEVLHFYDSIARQLTYKIRIRKHILIGGEILLVVFLFRKVIIQTGDLLEKHLFIAYTYYQTLIGKVSRKIPPIKVKL